MLAPIVTVEVPEPVIEFGLKWTARPCEAFTENDTIPEKPLRAETVMLEAPDVPESRVRDVGLAVRAKSTTLTMIVPVLCNRGPEDPVMLSV